MHTGFWWGNLRKGSHLEDSSVGGRIILKLNFKKWDEGVNWVDLTQVRESWRAVVNAVMNLGVP